MSILVLNSLKELVVNSDLHTQRLAMDFIISHFPIDNNIFSEEEKISLITSGLKLLVTNDYSTTRRLLIFVKESLTKKNLSLSDDISIIYD